MDSRSTGGHRVGAVFGVSNRVGIVGELAVMNFTDEQREAIRQAAAGLQVSVERLEYELQKIMHGAIPALEDVSRQMNAAVKQKPRVFGKPIWK